MDMALSSNIVRTEMGDKNATYLCSKIISTLPVDGNTAATVYPKYFGWTNWDAA